jgi:phosphoribosylaminoimidazole-succinocarboxamide synthase
MKIAEGKTKIIWSIQGVIDEVLIENKDQITAGDGVKRDIIENKGVLSNKTTCNCFRLLNSKGVATHFIKKINERTFRARRVRMIPVELVARRIATGSFLKRYPEVTEGTSFDELITELFLKDDAKHDPLIRWDDQKQCFELYDAKRPLEEGYLNDLSPEFLRDLKGLVGVRQLCDILTNVFLILEKAWANQNVSLIDLKIECGYDVTTGELLVADVIDNDSWRIWPGGKKTLMKDKQVYRDLEHMTPEDSTTIKKNYDWVAEATNKFIQI